VQGFKIQVLSDLLSCEHIDLAADESAIEELAKITDGDDLFDLSQDIINEDVEELDYDDEE
jgi:hypothetical protein